MKNEQKFTQKNCPEHYDVLQLFGNFFGSVHQYRNTIFYNRGKRGLTQVLTWVFSGFLEKTLEYYRTTNVIFKTKQKQISKCNVALHDDDIKMMQKKNKIGGHHFPSC